MANFRRRLHIMWQCVHLFKIQTIENSDGTETP